MNPQLFIAIDGGDCYDHVEAEVSDLIAAALNLEGVETLEMHPCCTNHENKPMCSPSGDVVSGNGECAEFLLPAGRYAIIPLPPEAE